MRFADLFALALANVRRNRTRSLLTLAGVAVGVGALLTLLAYGAALQGNARGEFERLDLYNTLRVTSRRSPFEGGPASVVSQSIANPDSARPEIPITDSLVAVYRRLPGVLDAYPEVTFPVKIEAGTREVFANAEAIPPSFAGLEGYRPIAGTFFASDSAQAVLMSPSMAERLGYSPAETAVGDTRHARHRHARPGGAAEHGERLRAGDGHPSHARPPAADAGGRPALRGRAAGVVVLPGARAAGARRADAEDDVLLHARPHDAPQQRARRLCGGARAAARPGAARARQSAAIERSGVYASSFRDQFAQLERLFLIVDFALAIVGFIALLVATLGIANTMTMNVVERRREIGVMKAVGGDEGTVIRLFVAESGVLGVLGGLFGIAAGFAVMGALQLAVSTYLTRKRLPDVDVFAPSFGLVLAVLAVALAVSLLAGLAPARRAARVEPVEALRA